MADKTEKLTENIEHHESKQAKWWGNLSPELKDYHDYEWGVPKHDDRELFELLSMETYQAGLNWRTVLQKRDAFNQAFYNYDVAKVAAMMPDDIDRLMQNPALIRNYRKLAATVTNAQAVIKVQQEFGSFDHYLWQFVDFKPIVNQPESPDAIPTQTELSVKLAADMKKRGFKFVGPVTIYSYLQGAGLIDDHLKGWHREQV